jgi:hypothetical protein
VLIECATVFRDVRISGFASRAAASASAPPHAIDGAAQLAPPTPGCGLLCKISAGPHSLLPQCVGAFSLFCFHTGAVQINACGGASLAHAQLLARNVHCFLSSIRPRIEPSCPAEADGSRRKRALPLWAAPPPTKRKRVAAQRRVADAADGAPS